MNQFSEVRTRFAPSPSGYLHVGGARTALFNYLYARAQNGKFILRVEDTDQDRSSPESEKVILDSLKWLGIKADEGPNEGGEYWPYRQSERLSIYEKYTERLLENKDAYRCFCTHEELEAKQKRSKEMGIPHIYDGKCRGLSQEEIDKRINSNVPFAVRFRVEPGEITINDIVQGRVKFDSRLIGDFIIVKSDGYPSYNYAVVIDDHEMKISHVIRGVGHLSNTPRQILIHQKLKMKLPAYAHISEIVDTDKKKLSKRRAATSVLFFKDMGFLSEAFVNYMALLGWYPEDAQEFLPDGQLEKKFSIERCSKSPAMFDFFLTENSSENEDDTFDPASLTEENLAKVINKKSKLIWLNNKYIRHLSIDRAWEEAMPFISSQKSLSAKIKTDPEHMKQTFDAIRVYVDTLKDAIPYMLEIFKENESPEADAAETLKSEGALEVVQKFKQLVISGNPATPDDFKDIMKLTGEACSAKNAKLFMPIRCATTGSKQGLELPSLFTILGPENVVRRIESIVGSLV